MFSHQFFTDMSFKRELASLLNRHGYDTLLNMPDYALAEFVDAQLNALSMVEKESARHRTGQLEQRLDRIEKLLINNQKTEESIIMDLTRFRRA